MLLNDLAKSLGQTNYGIGRVSTFGSATALPVTSREVEKPDGRHEVGPQSRHVEGHGTDRLAAVDHQMGAELVRARAHRVEFD